MLDTKATFSFAIYGHCGAVRDFSVGLRFVVRRVSRLNYSCVFHRGELMCFCFSFSWLLAAFYFFEASMQFASKKDIFAWAHQLCVGSTELNVNVSCRSLGNKKRQYASIHISTHQYTSIAYEDFGDHLLTRRKCITNKL